MRLLIDILVAVMVAAILSGVAWRQHCDQAEAERIAQTRMGVQIIQKQIKLQSAVGLTPLNERGFPTTIDPAWFEEHALPDNPLVESAHPWLEIASPDQRNLTHPPERLAIDSRLAKFWYNPANGVVRARVGVNASDAHSLALYNQVNDCGLTSLFDDTSRE